MPYKMYSDDMSPIERSISCVTFCIDWVYRVLLEYSKAVLLVIVVIVSAQVFSRKFLGSSIMWSEEVALVLMVWMAFIAMAIGVERGLHIAIEMFVNMMPPIVQRIIEKINDLATLCFGIALVRYGVPLIKITWKSTLPATQWPAGVKYLMMPVGGFFIVYFSLLSLFNLSKYRHADIEGDDIGEEAAPNVEGSVAKGGAVNG